MKEVEIKIQISNPGTIIKIFQDQGYIFSEPMIQHDRVFIPENEPTMPVAPGINVLRIRRQGNKNVLTLKRSDIDNHLSKIEHELEICDSEEMERMINLLGFKMIADTTKSRTKCKVGNYEICVDHVTELGDYLEIEQITDQDPALVQKQMLDFLSKNGIDTTQQISVGYDILYIRKKLNIS
jgi:predicted adenylyl cyclase CyaB